MKILSPTPVEPFYTTSVSMHTMQGNHVISFDWQGFHPHLRCYDESTGKISDLDFWKMNLAVSHRSACVGSWEGGGHSPCPTSERVTGGSICQECASSFLPDPGCMFEPRCNGEICGVDFCSREHLVYLAFHGRVTKVGMTSSRRLEQRMIEQGCDAFAVVARIDGRKTARTMESALADNLALRQRVRSIESLAGLTEAVPVGEIESQYCTIAEKVEEFGHRPSPLKFLEDYPIGQPLKEMPRELRVAGEHRGKALGVKGKFLIYDDDGLKALNLQKMPGRFIKPFEERPSKSLEHWL